MCALFVAGLPGFDLVHVLVQQARDTPTPIIYYTHGLPRCVVFVLELSCSLMPCADSTHGSPRGRV